MKDTPDYNVNHDLSAADKSKSNTAVINLVISPNCIGLRLDLALARLLPQLSRSRLQTWILNARVVVNEQITVNLRQKVWGNEHVQITPQVDMISIKHTAEAIKLAIVYEDDWLLVINKPAGMVVHPGNGNWHGTMLNALLYHTPRLNLVPRAGIVHRLDKNTSGLLVVAKTIEVQLDLVHQLQKHTVARNYLALVLGEVLQNGYIDAPVGRHHVHRTKMTVTEKGKPARTHYKILKKFEGCTLLKCSLETGRTHQIRVHMHSIGHPLVGDQVYGGKPAKSKQAIICKLISFPRQALHAAQLALKHPHNQQNINWEVAPPDDMSLLLQGLQHQNQERCLRIQE